MDNSLMIISVYDEWLEKIQTVCNELSISPTIIEWEHASKELVLLLKDKFLIETPPEVIISRGAVANLIQENFSTIVVIRAEPDDIDLLGSIVIAKHYGLKIGVLLYEPLAYGYRSDTVKNALSLQELQVYSFNSKADIENMIKLGKKEKMDAMVGGGTLGQRIGKAINIPVVFSETSARSIRLAIIQAIIVIHARKRERLQFKYFHTAISSVDEGIMTIKDNRITLINKMLANILQVNSNDIIEQNVHSLKETTVPQQVHQFIKLNNPDEKIIKINKNFYLLRKIPISILRDGTSSEEYIIIFKDITEIQKQELLIRRELLNKGFIAKYHFADIVGKSTAIQNVISRAKIFAPANANILLVGDSGVGKELFAQSIHNMSIRRNQPFVAVNCAAIPENLLESELFGYEEGSFSGAKKGGKSGLFELAHGGTIFLDEVNSLPISLQGVLLRVIQEKEVRRIGSSHIISVDTRIISATNKNMGQLLSEGLFRKDLLYRLNTLNLTIPSLSERSEDVLPLAKHFLERYSNYYHVDLPYAFTKEDENTLLKMKWFGNVRELENVIHRFVILSQNKDDSVNIGNCTDINYLQIDKPTNIEVSNNAITIPKGTLQEMEKYIIQSYLETNKNSKDAVARQLGICRTTLWKKST